MPADNYHIRLLKAAEDDFTEIDFKGNVGVKNVVEISIPRTQIKLDKEYEINLRVRVYKQDQLIETWPSLDLIKYQAHPEDQSIFWQV